MRPSVMLQIAEDSGFRPPHAGFVKDDPRGNEYGHFEIHDVGGTIHLIKRGDLSWHCTFDTALSFKNWAADCT